MQQRKQLVELAVHNWHFIYVRSQDALAAVDYCVSRAQGEKYWFTADMSRHKNVSGAPVIIYGESLGGAVGIYAAVSSKHKHSIGRASLFLHISSPIVSTETRTFQAVSFFKTHSRPFPTWWIRCKTAVTMPMKPDPLPCANEALLSYFAPCVISKPWYSTTFGAAIKYIGAFFISPICVTPINAFFCFHRCVLFITDTLFFPSHVSCLTDFASSLLSCFVFEQVKRSATDLIHQLLHITLTISPPSFSQYGRRDSSTAHAQGDLISVVKGDGLPPPPPPPFFVIFSSVVCSSLFLNVACSCLIFSILLRRM